MGDLFMDSFMEEHFFKWLWPILVNFRWQIRPQLNEERRGCGKRFYEKLFMCSCAFERCVLSSAGDLDETGKKRRFLDKNELVLVRIFEQISLRFLKTDIRYLQDWPIPCYIPSVLNDDLCDSCDWCHDISRSLYDTFSKHTCFRWHLLWQIWLKQWCI